MRIAPLLNPLRTSGGTFYTLSTAIDDLVLLFSANENIRFNFSKFVCLNLPDWKNQTEQRLFRDASDIGDPLITDPNTVFVKAYIQNYIENLLSYTPGNRTDNDKFRTFAEAAFFKSLRYVSDTDLINGTNTQAIQFQEDVTYIKPDLSTGQKYIEIPNDQSIGSPYQRVIQYIGDINMLNNVKTDEGEYLEVYAHIPNIGGSVIDPKFKPLDTIRFNSGVLPSSNGDQWISGREDAFNLGTNNVKAIYDDQLNLQYNLSNDLNFLGIDFEEFEGRTNDSLRYSNENFEFNAILLYYDVWNKQDESTRRRNLFGVLLLDPFTDIGGTSEINRLIKYAPDSVKPGNSYGFRFNFKFQNYSNQVSSEIMINDYNTLSMELYLEALQRLQGISDQYNELSDKVIKQQQDIQALKIALLNQ